MLYPVRRPRVPSRGTLSFFLLARACDPSTERPRAPRLSPLKADESEIMEEESIKVDKSYFGVLSTSIDNAALLKKMRGDELRLDPYNRERLAAYRKRWARHLCGLTKGHHQSEPRLNEQPPVLCLIFSPPLRHSATASCNARCRPSLTPRPRARRTSQGRGRTRTWARTATTAEGEHAGFDALRHHSHGFYSRL